MPDQGPFRQQPLTASQRRLGYMPTSAPNEQDYGLLRNYYGKKGRLGNEKRRNSLIYKKICLIFSPLLYQLSYLPGLEPTGLGDNARRNLDRANTISLNHGFRRVKVSNEHSPLCITAPRMTTVARPEVDYPEQYEHRK